MSAIRLRALIAALVLCASSVPAQAGQVAGVLPGGGSFIVDPMGSAPAAAVELWYRAPSVGFGSSPVPSLARLAAETVVASKPLTGKPLGTLVAEAGGRIAVNVYGDSVAISIFAPAGAAPALLRAMTTAFFAPVVTEDGWHAAQRAVAQEALLQSFNPDDVTRDAVFDALFASGPAHYPVLGSARGIERIALDDVRMYASRAFRSQNAVLATAGDVEPSIVKSAVSGRSPSSAETARPEPALASVPARMPRSLSRTMEDAGGAYGWIGPAITDVRAATAMDFIADYLFRPEVGAITHRIGLSQPQASVSGQFITLHNPGVFFVAFTSDMPSRTKSIVDEGLTSMRTPMEAGAFERALDAFEYHLLADLQTPLSVADNFGWYAVEGNLPYAPGANEGDGAYFQALRSLTPGFVASVVRTYLDKPGVTVVLSPPKASAKKKGSAS